MNLQHVTLGSGATFDGDEPIFSDAVRYGGLLFLSGRAPVDPVTLKVVSEGFEQQTETVLRDVARILEQEGSQRDHVLRVECFLANADDFTAWNRIWREHFAAPRPARTTVVAAFAVPGILIELQVIAAIATETA
jgi:2-iminobutanoate/2-iminopropanoate deaminase